MKASDVSSTTRGWASPQCATSLDRRDTRATVPSSFLPSRISSLEPGRMDLDRAFHMSRSPAKMDTTSAVSALWGRPSPPGSPDPRQGARSASRSPMKEPNAPDSMPPLRLLESARKLLSIAAWTPSPPPRLASAPSTAPAGDPEATATSPSHRGPATVLSTPPSPKTLPSSVRKSASPASLSPRPRHLPTTDAEKPSNLVSSSLGRSEGGQARSLARDA